MDNIKIVVIVQGGVVQDIYSSHLDLEVEVIDLDISSFPEDGELEEREDKIDKVEELRKNMYPMY